MWIYLDTPQRKGHVYIASGSFTVRRLEGAALRPFFVLLEMDLICSPSGMHTAPSSASMMSVNDHRSTH